MTAFMPAAGPAVERDIARDIAKRALLVAPVLVAVGALVRGVGGALGVAVALAIVAGNFLLAAALLTAAARVSLTLVMVAGLGGFFVRLALVTVLGIGVKQLASVDFTVFCITLIASHLGLLFWETQHISLTLAAPGLKPKKEER